MRLECAVDKRAWVEVKDAWTRNDVRHFWELSGAASITVPDLPEPGQASEEVRLAIAERQAQKQAAMDALRAYYKAVVKDACVVDVNGVEYKGVESVFGADDMGDLDAAVASFWVMLPQLAYNERLKLGEVKRVS
jgi:hypothetical protein